MRSCGRLASRRRRPLARGREGAVNRSHVFRQLEYIVALDRERHFVRAAQSCSVSQPALSEGIRKLEEELDVPLIHRGNKFGGLTAEGQQLVVWARRILADREGLKEEIGAMRAGLSGQLRFGSVPTASIAVSLLTAPFCAGTRWRGCRWSLT